MRRLDQFGDLGEGWGLVQPSELIRGDGEVGAWSLVNFMATDLIKFIVEVAMEVILTSLATELVGIHVGFGCYDGGFIVSACLPISVVGQTLLSFLVSFVVTSPTVDAYHKQLSTEA